MKVSLGDWVPVDLQNEDGLYSEKEVKAIRKRTTDDIGKRLLDEILSCLRTPHQRSLL